MKREYIDISAYTGEGYQPMIDFKTWRVAILRYCEELELHNIKTMQKHDETDEVFVLLAGQCTLFVGGKGDEINDLDAVAMEPYQLYNLKQGVWHTHTLDKNATVLIVENQDTTSDNSPTQALSKQQLEELAKLYSK